jgi:hypothetical protein
MRDIDDLAVKIHATAREHGFWDKERNFGEMLMLVASELAEALEEDRNGKPSIYWKCKSCGYEDLYTNHVKHYIRNVGTMRRVLDRLGFSMPMILCDETRLKPEGALVEIADAIIRLMDTGQAEVSKTQYTLGEVIEHKMDYNDSRKHMHGKAY